MTPITPSFRQETNKVRHEAFTEAAKKTIRGTLSKRDPRASLRSNRVVQPDDHRPPWVATQKSAPGESVIPGGSVTAVTPFSGLALYWVSSSVSPSGDTAESTPEKSPAD